MSSRIHWATALASAVAVIAIGSSAAAQSQSQYRSMIRTSMGSAPQSAAAEELPAGKVPAEQSPSNYSMGSYPGLMGDTGYFTNAGGACGGDGYCGCGEQPACGNDCGCNECGPCFMVVEYLAVRSTFSEATAFIRQDLGAGTEEFVPFDFDFESSFRVGGGCRLCRCGEEIRFMYTRFHNDADATAFPGDVVPFGADPPPDGRTEIDAEVEANIFDLEWAKTIPLGGQAAGCGDACGCGDGCGHHCPAWDVTWFGGVRGADVNWERNYTAFDDTDFPVTDVETELDFDGIGLRTGLEGRRYFFKDGWLSVFGKGSISLLVGDVDINTTRVSDDGVSVVRQFYSNRQLIPVTDLEAGVTAQISCRTAISAGYLMSAWHDLGFRNAFDVCDCDGATLLGSKFDDANILGFDGLFARLECCF
jgi:hypothetical protein